MLNKLISAAALVVVAFLPTKICFAQVTSVSSSSELQQAMNAVPDGGIIEVSGGTYSAPNGGFTMFAPKGFTVRPAAGANVILDGRGSTDILRLNNGMRGTGKAVMFEHITFVNGSQSAENAVGGAITLVNTDAIFTNCSFQNNSVNPSTTGGGAQWINNSDVAFSACTWTGNSSRNYGGAMSVLKSRVFITLGKFSNNRANVPGHIVNSPGGAIFANTSTMRISGTTFDSNAAGYVGGAIYAFGEWQDPAGTPSMDLTLNNCLFSNNFAQPDPSVTINTPPVGGAIHVEDQTTATVQNCRFINNFAKLGGAISNYRAITNFQGCVFRGNVATGTAGGEAIGGAIIALSADNADGSTNSGQINRRSAVVAMTDCLIQGDGSTSNARDGGAIFISGDLNAEYGLNGIRQDRAIANRATAVLTRVVFDHLVTAASGGIPASAGAIGGDFATVNMQSSFIMSCRTTESGGAASFVRDSIVTLTDSTLTSNTAGTLGGAIAAVGGTLNLNGVSLVNNSLPGGKGAAITTVPLAAVAGYYPQNQPMTGLVQNCMFGSNNGTSVLYDGDSRTAPFNQMQYSNNQFYPNSAATYVDDLSRPTDVDGLNALTIPVSGVKKAPVANTALGAPPGLAKVLLIPPVAARFGAAGEGTPIPSYLAYASFGGTPMIDGTSQRLDSGVIATVNDAAHTLTCGGAKASTTPLPAVALNISTRLQIGAGENVLIGGFIIGGSTQKRVLVRAIAPSPTVAGALEDPVLEVHDHTGALVAQNDNWRTTIGGPAITVPQTIDIAGTGVAPTSDAESALIATLNPYPERYTAVVRGANGSTGIGLVEAYDLDTEQTSTLANISTRGLVRTGDNVMIGGFIVGGGGGTTKVVVRGLGPSLSVGNPLVDPTLDLVNEQGTIVESNDDWESGRHAAELRAAGLAPSKPSEAAIYRTDLARARYTAVVRGKNGGTGVGLVEVYVFQ